MDLQSRLSNHKLRRGGGYHRYKAVETYELSSSTRTSFVSRPDDALGRKLINRLELRAVS